MHYNRFCGFIAVSILILLLNLFPSQREQAQTIPYRLADKGRRGFIAYRGEEGVMSRRMLEQEIVALSANESRQALHSLISVDSFRSAARQQESGNWKINLRGTQQLEGFPQAKAAFLRAAARWESALQARLLNPGQNFSVDVNVDFGLTYFGAAYPSPNTVGASVIDFFGLFAVTPFPDIFSAFSVTPQQLTTHRALPFPIKTEFGETVALRWTEPVYRTLGGDALPFPVSNTIGFNSAVSFDFDSSNGVDADKLDFETLALRELGRVMGMVSEVGERELNPLPIPSPFGFAAAFPSTWDLYRFRPGVTMENFTMATRVQRSGGEQVFFTGDAELPLSTGRSDGTGGDGRPAGHWKDDALTGQYIGVMDPTYAAGERGGITANDLLALSYFGYRIRPGTEVMEALSHDDNSREETVTSNGALVVNRFTPSRYPFTVQAARVHLAQPAEGGSPVGRPLRIVLFVDAARTGRPPTNPQLLVDRTITIPALPQNRVLEVMLPNGPTINGGDLYVGVQSSSSGVSFGGDANGAPCNCSFISVNNGASFEPLRAGANARINAMLRVVVAARFDASNNAAPELATLSPTAIAPGAQGLKLVVQGGQFKSETIDGGGFRYKSVVRWNGQERPTTFLSPSLLRADISAADLSGAGKARVTVFTSGPDGGRESAPLELNIAAEHPAPVLTRLDPSVVGVAAPGSGEATLVILGRNFTSGSVARLNGANRATRFTSSVKLEVTLPASDLASAVDAEISVITPAPGGGVSNTVMLRIAPCGFRLSRTSQTVGAARLFDENGEINPGGVLLETDGHCPWTARSDADWIKAVDLSGVGSGPVGYNVLNNPGPAPRTGVITIAGQALTINQVGSPTAVSSASFGQGSAPESIATIFGVGLAKSAQVATTMPLPTTLAGTTVTVARPGGGRPQPAPLFFVSPNQINFLVPSANDGAPPRPGGNAFLSVFVDGQLLSDGYISLAPVAPGLFSANASGGGLAGAIVLRVKADGARQFEPVGVFDPGQNRFIARPIDLGPETEKVFLLLFGTGIRGRNTLFSVEVRIGGLSVPVLYAGAQADFPGLDQINVELPRALMGRGEVPVVCTVSGSGSNQVTITIK